MDKRVDSCDFGTCEKRSVYCFLLSVPDPVHGAIAYRYDLCEEHAQAFRTNPPEIYTGTEARIIY